MTSSYAKERQIAELAVQKAVSLTKQALRLSTRGQYTKEDKTAVSIADFAAQAILVAAIHNSFPDDAIVGEEDTSLLREKPELAEKVRELVYSTHLTDATAEALLYSPTSLEETLASIDRGGQGYGGPRGRLWFIDPIDGTKGFLNHGQYAVCVILLVDGEEKVAAFGCPHISLAAQEISESTVSTDGPGYLVSAVRGQGADIRPLSSGALKPSMRLPRRESIKSLSKLRFCENIKTTTPQFSERSRIAEELGAPWQPTHIYSTQLRYVSLALGFSDVVLRTPLPADPPAHVWDHAGGVMLFEEVGGQVTDLDGKPLQLTTGRDLTENFGLVAAPAQIHGRVLGAVKAVFSRYPEYAERVS